nr:MAG TPA: hypothetical protein [Caudoviricetes sp.]
MHLNQYMLIMATVIDNNIKDTENEQPLQRL